MDGQNRMIQKIQQYEQELLTADGFDEAIIGIDTRSDKVVYSVSKCIDILEGSMSREEALEYFYFNVESAYLGERTPIWCNDM